MDEPGIIENPTASRRSFLRPTWLLWLLLAASVFALLVMAELSPGRMAWMRDHWQFFNWPMLRIEWLELRTGLNVQHILVFGWIALLLRFAWPTPGWVWPWLLMLALAIFIELAQFLSPGRTPRFTDIRDDLLGAAFGWCLAALIISIARRVGTVLHRCPAGVGSSEGQTSETRGEAP